MNNHVMDPRVYFIKPVGMPGPIKIGHSNYSQARLGTLAAWSPAPLEIIGSAPGTLAVEKAIHDCFADCHSHREWFHPHPRLLAFIEAVVSGVPIAEAVDLDKPVGSVRKLKMLAAKARKGTSEETVCL